MEFVPGPGPEMIFCNFFFFCLHHALKNEILLRIIIKAHCRVVVNQWRYLRHLGFWWDAGRRCRSNGIIPMDQCEMIKLNFILTSELENRELFNRFIIF